MIPEAAEQPDNHGAVSAGDERGNVDASLIGTLSQILSATQDGPSCTPVLHPESVQDSGDMLSGSCSSPGVLPSATSFGLSDGDVNLADDLAVAEATVYELPTWAEFRTFVMENGDKYVRASYPDAPADLIETIWCGVPVIHHEQARVMTPNGEWLVY